MISIAINLLIVEIHSLQALQKENIAKYQIDYNHIEIEDQFNHACRYQRIQTDSIKDMADRVGYCEHGERKCDMLPARVHTDRF